jgi:transposase InsO family protein
VPRLKARGPNQVWSWAITYLPTSVRRVWLYLYLVIDVWSPKVVAWDVAEREEAQIAADLVSRACLRERISKGRPSPLILHADNGSAMRAATLESRLEELGVLRCFFRPRVRNDNSTRNRCSTPCRRSPAERLKPAGLPPEAIPKRRAGLRLGGGICGLVQPPAPPQRHPVRDTRSAP